MCVLHVLQCSSSDASLQCFTPSHSRLRSRQQPLLQISWSGRHVDPHTSEHTDAQTHTFILYILNMQSWYEEVHCGTDQQQAERCSSPTSLWTKKQQHASSAVTQLLLCVYCVCTVCVLSVYWVCTECVLCMCTVCVLHMCCVYCILCVCTVRCVVTCDSSAGRQTLGLGQEVVVVLFTASEHKLLTATRRRVVTPARERGTTRADLLWHQTVHWQRGRSIKFQFECLFLSRHWWSHDTGHLVKYCTSTNLRYFSTSLHLSDSFSYFTHLHL